MRKKMYSKVAANLFILLSFNNAIRMNNISIKCIKTSTKCELEVSYTPQQKMRNGICMVAFCCFWAKVDGK